MFGYVTVYKPELKVKEYEAYKGVYCTLCKEMGKEYGALSRFLLSYDGAFYVIYKMGLSNEKVTAEKSRCTFNPAKKCAKITCESDIYKLASTITIVLAYFKLIDNLKDSKGIKKLFLYLLLPYFSHLKRKALKKHPDIFTEIEKGMQTQFEIEQEKNVMLDKSAHPTAKMLGWLFSFNECEKTKQSAYDFGYQLGRVVYFLDAFDDYEKDIKENTYNPLKNEKNYIEAGTRSINMSIGALTQVFESQSKNQFSPIIENVIYDGLNYQVEKITKKNRGESCE
ncbi:MAG: hypothetical protein IKU15_05580 [Clostridia bacterium]|nr:hypothetical protein [Clostridia bacterium]